MKKLKIKLCNGGFSYDKNKKKNLNCTKKSEIIALHWKI